MRYVVDASVVVKSLLPEAGSEYADAVLASHRGGELILVAPELVIAEVANAIHKKAFVRRTIALAEAEKAFADFLKLGLYLYPLRDLAENAFRLAITHRHPIYDAFYVALAQRESCSLITADSRLLRSFDLPLVISLDQFRP